MVWGGSTFRPTIFGGRARGGRVKAVGGERQGGARHRRLENKAPSVSHILEEFRLTRTETLYRGQIRRYMSLSFVRIRMVRALSSSDLRWAMSRNGKSS
jgi:hypothetical protein